MRNDELNLLRRLASDSCGVAQSSLRVGTRPLVERLQACGAVTWQRGKSGRGRRLVMSDRDAFNLLINDALPNGLNFDDVKVVDHATAIVARADAKAFNGSNAEAVLMRTAASNIVLNAAGGDDGQCIAVSELSKRAGCAAIKLADKGQWAFSGSIAVIENGDPFWQFESVLPQVDLAIYAGGRMSSRFIRWLASETMQSCPIIHWGDYDPVGVDEYTRLYEACGARVRFHVVANLESLLPRYGKRSLIQTNVKTLEGLRGKTNIPQVARMVELFDEHRKGLEQEILLQMPAK